MLGHDYIEKSIINSALAWISHICCKSIIMYTVSAEAVLVIYVAVILKNIIVVCGAIHHSVEFCASNIVS